MNLDEKQTAKLLGLAVQTLRNWRTQSKGPPYIKISRTVRYNLADIKAYVKLHRIAPEESVNRGSIQLTLH
jgi:DNA-binding transcriptional MerR regulator